MNTPWTAVTFDEPGAAALTGRLDEFTRLVSSSLLEAEPRAAFARKEAAFPESALDGIDWILPDRPLAPELAAALEVGYLRGAETEALGSPDLGYPAGS